MLILCLIRIKLLPQNNQEINSKSSLYWENTNSGSDCYVFSDIIHSDYNQFVFLLRLISCIHFFNEQLLFTSKVIDWKAIFSDELTYSLWWLIFARNFVRAKFRNILINIKVQSLWMFGNKNWMNKSVCVFGTFSDNVTESKLFHKGIFCHCKY